MEQLSIARGLSYGLEKVKLCENLITAAQKLGNTELEYKARCELLEAVVFSNQQTKVLPTFAWIIAEQDRNPDKHGMLMFLWYYKWVIVKLPKFTSIPRERIMAVADDMQKRYATSGYGLGPFHHCMKNLHLSMGELDLADKHFELQRQQGGSFLDDCKACMINDDVYYEHWKGNPQASIDAADDLLTGKQSCKEVPLATYPIIMHALTSLSRHEKAIPYYKRFIKEKEDEKSYLLEYKYLLIYLAITQNYTEAREAFIDQYPYVNLHASDSEIFHFLIGALIYMKALMSSNISSITLPAQLVIELPHQDYEYQVSDLMIFFEQRVDAIGVAFNERNGNKHYDSYKVKALDMIKLSKKVKL